MQINRTPIVNRYPLTARNLEEYGRVQKALSDKMQELKQGRELQNKEIALLQKQANKLQEQRIDYLTELENLKA